MITTLWPGLRRGAKLAKDLEGKQDLTSGSSLIPTPLKVELRPSRGDELGSTAANFLGPVSAAGGRVKGGSQLL